MKPGVTEKESAELREARKRIRLLEQEAEVMRRAVAYLSRDVNPKCTRWSANWPPVGRPLLAIDTGHPRRLGCRTSSGTRNRCIGGPEWCPCSRCTIQWHCKKQDHDTQQIGTTVARYQPRPYSTRARVAASARIMLTVACASSSAVLNHQPRSPNSALVRSTIPL